MVSQTKRFILFFSFLFALSLLATPAMAQPTCEKKADNFIILFDQSGSMGEEYMGTGKSKQMWAKEILNNLYGAIPNLAYQSALVTFTPWTENYPLSTYDKDRFGAAVNAIPDNPRISGMFGHPTPLGGAMFKLNDYMTGMKGRTVVFIFTDGRNTDDRDPLEWAQNVAKKHDVCFVIVSLATKKSHMELLQKMADTTPCGKVIPFEECCKNPQVFADELCKKIDRPAPIPVVVVPPKPAPGITQIGMIHFDFDKSAIKDQYKDDLNRIAATLKDKPKATLLISGFCDWIGTEAYNMKLGMRRAESAKAYLVDKGISPDRIKTTSYGEDSPIATNKTKDGRAQNRRAEFLLMEEGAM